jgi:hypothetical protein
MDSLDQSKVRCHKCEGNGMYKNYMGLLNICHKCGGHGSVDWVSAVVKGSNYNPDKNRNVELIIVKENIHTLRLKIIDMGMEVGMHLTVNIKTLDDPYKNLLPRSPNHIMKIGDY